VTAVDQPVRPDQVSRIVRAGEELSAAWADHASAWTDPALRADAVEIRVRQAVAVWSRVNHNSSPAEQELAWSQLAAPGWQPDREAE
jgi:hypothetical protein